MQKVAILTVEKNPIATDLFLKLAGQYEAFIIYTPRKGVCGLDSLSRYIKRKRGVRWLLYDLLFVCAKRKYGTDHIPARGWDELLNAFSGNFYEMDGHNSSETARVLEGLKPDVGVLIGTALIKPEIFNIPQHGMINLHQADLTVLRGAPPAFWEHQKRLKEMCVTVHRVVEKLDAGAVFEKEYFSIREDKHFIISKFRANSISADLLHRGVEKALNQVNGMPPRSLGELKTVPGFLLLFKNYLQLVCS